MIIFNQLLFIVVLLALFLISGALILYFLKYKQSFSLAILSGFCFVLAVVFVITLLARLLCWPLSTICTISVCIILLLSTVFVIVIYKQEIFTYYALQIKNVIEHIANNKTTYLFFILIIIALVFFSCCCYWRSSDDSYYMPRIMEMIEENNIFLSESYSWLGYNLTAFNESTDISSYSMLCAIFSIIFNVPSTVLCKNGFAILLIIVSFASLWQMFGSVFTNDKNKLAKQETSIIVCYLSLIVVGAYFNYGYSLPYWQIRNIWHGKTMLYTIIYPFIFKICFDIYNTEKNGYLKANNLILLAVVITSALSMTIIGVIFPAVLCFAIGLPFVIYCIVNKKLRIKSLIQIVLAAMPTIICSVGMFIYISLNNDTYSSIYETPNWLQTFKDCLLISNGKFFIIYLLSSLYLLIKGNKVQKLILVGTPIALFATFLNPLLTTLVSKYITTSSVYWRLYLLLPIWYVPSVVVGNILNNNLSKFSKKIVVLCLLVLSCVFLLYVSTTTQLRENAYSVPQDAIELADLILSDYSGTEDPVLYAFDDDKYTENIRQYTNKIDLLTGIRKDQRDKNGVDEIVNITNQLSDDTQVYEYQIAKVLGAFKVDYCCVEKKRFYLIPDCEQLVKIAETDNLILYKTVQ